MALPAESLRPSGRKILSVGDLTRRIKKSIDDTIDYVWVAGEISNLRPAGPRGHLYFTIKDDESQLPCAMWRTFVGRLRFRPENGMEVIAGGTIDVYVPYGRYQLIVDQMEPKGVGALQLRFEQLKEKLNQEGLFDESRKKPLPFLPRKLALVTSPTGAAVQDMLRTIRSRCPDLHVLVYPVRVQGDGSADEIAAAIGHLNLAMPDVDVMIVGRGGGSIEDLWAFNEEAVARAIAASRIPIVSAVGHETDTTIADFVADVRALTPTDGALKAVPALADLHLSLEDLGTKLKRSLKSRSDLARAELDGLRDGRALGRVEEMPQVLTQRLDDLLERLDVAAGQATVYRRERLDLLKSSLYSDLPRVPELARERVMRLTDRMRSVVKERFDGASARIREAAGKLDALSPLKILGRGYSITRLEDGSILTDPSQAKPGDRLITRLDKGELRSRTEK